MNSPFYIFMVIDDFFQMKEKIPKLQPQVHK